MPETRPGWGSTPFTEKAFYLAEFRGRTLALAPVAGAVADPATVREVLAELESNQTPILLLSSDERWQAALDATLVEARGAALPGAVWRALQVAPRASLILEAGPGFAGECRQVAAELGLSKLVFLDPAGALVRADGSRLSFVDSSDLSDLLAAPRGDSAKREPLLREVESALRSGVPAVNVCTAEGLGEELFSYAGSGTLFTRDRYVDVRKLGIDDLGAAHDLVARGVEEGYLAERGSDELDRVLAGGYGAFVEGRHMAGIGALLPHDADSCSEIASLYTLTRFIGEGIGGHLVSALCRRAEERADDYLFACTTSDRVAGFFERLGFARVGHEAVPSRKWEGYDPARRDRVHCLRRDTTPART